MQFRLGVTLVAAVALCLTATLEAQERGQRGQRGGPGGFGGGFGAGGMGGGTTRLALLRISAVREELNLTEEQVAAIEEFQASQRRGGGGERGRRGGEGQPRGRRGAPQTDARGAADWYFVQEEGRRGQFSPERLEEFRRAAEERAQQEREKLAEILLPNQLKRLNQIYVQVAGTAALNDADIAKELGITDEQREKMATVRIENAEAMRAQFAEFRDLEPEQRRAKVEELRKQGDEKLLAVLNDEQKKKFEEMKGEKFDLPEGALRGGFGGGRGGPGGAPGAPGRRGGQRGNQ
jgi:hypothetical protein